MPIFAGYYFKKRVNNDRMIFYVIIKLMFIKKHYSMINKYFDNEILYFEKIQEICNQASDLENVLIGK